MSDDVTQESLDESLSSLELTIQRHLDETQSLRDQLAASEQEIALLRAKLEKYGQHKFGCKALGKTQSATGWGFIITDPEPCDCGLVKPPSVSEGT